METKLATGDKIIVFGTIISSRSRHLPLVSDSLLTTFAMFIFEFSFLLFGFSVARII